MYIEYSYYDIASKDQEVVDNITEALKFNINAISVLPPHVKAARSIIPSNHITKLSCPIDFPLGLLDSKSRLSVAENCIKNGANILEAVCPVQFLCNRKYDKLREDIKNLYNLCETAQVKLRYVLEYRQFTYELLYKVAEILFEFNIKEIYPSTGYSLDDISDNILAAALINKRVPHINIICTGNLWNNAQAKTAKNSKLYGLKINSINGLRLIYQENGIEN